MNYQLITDTQTLNQLCQGLLKEKWLAIDTEFMRQDTFFAQLAMIQIAIPSLEVYLIDPLSIDDLDALWALLADKKVLKVFHAARQDLEVLYQHAYVMPGPIFDTQVAGVFLGLGDQAGYARLVETFCNDKINKDQARTPWLERPLLAEQLEYAAADVWYLAQAYPKILHLLTPTQRQALEADFNALTDPTLYAIEPDRAWLRIKLLSGLKPKQLGVLKQLAAWRERQAVERNQPRKWVISDDALLQLAKRPVRTVEELPKLNKLTPEIIREQGADLINQLDLTLQNPDCWPELPEPIALNTNQQTLLPVLLAISQQTASTHGIHLPNLANKQELAALILNQPSQLNQGWRHVLLGKKLQQFLQGQLHLRVDNKLAIQPRLELAAPLF
ncbi:ribonuclease D [Thiomicrospira sp. ALE5]|uniref:ribonuclease D n=1 Tax=Thiomicrospira sp. ALE5 TaxID=748650 RepID=UPI0008E3209B|nr:ribonuclease D [Thiomicrospira sp. ALE5]SFR53481.1 ribonuclease D [Thiomicrospira sp. ALE5]